MSSSLGVVVGGCSDSDVPTEVGGRGSLESFTWSWAACWSDIGCPSISSITAPDRRVVSTTHEAIITNAAISRAGDPLLEKRNLLISTPLHAVSRHELSR